MLRAVFFDAGGTLVHPDYARVAEVLRRSAGRAPTPEALREAEYAGRAAVEAAMAGDPALTDGSRWQLHFAGALTALGYSPFQLRQAGPEIRAEHERANLWTVPAPGGAEGLAALRRLGLIVGCISNSDGTVERLLAEVGLAPLLDPIVDSGAVGVEKPDPEIFRIALRRAGVTAADALYVGDLFPVDVVGARRAGLEPVLLDPLGRYGDRGCRTTPDVAAFCRALVSSRGRG